jgi:hypothetical protein
MRMLISQLRCPIRAVLLFSFSFAILPACAQRPETYGVIPGNAQASIQQGTVSLSNRIMEASWALAKNDFRGLNLIDREDGTKLSLPSDAFSIVFRDGTSIHASQMKIVDGPRIETLQPAPKASRGSERSAGKAILLRLQDSKGRVLVTWRAIMRDDSDYFRQEVAITALGGDQAISEVRLFDGSLPGAAVAGLVKGSPVIAGNVFLGFENPLSECSANGVVTCSMKRELPLRLGQVVHYSLVIGVSPPGQMRRAFLSYIEQERAHPYRTFLHYNTWYDIGYGERYNAAAVQDVIQAFGTELVRKRGVKMDSFLLDDGWDDPRSLWHVNAGFPQGLAPLKSAAEKYGAELGIWLSPWGGYNEAKALRLEYGKKSGFEMNAGGFALSGPKYYATFRDATRNFILKDNINQLKIDGTGNVDSVFPGSSFDSDFAAAISLIQDWRQWKPDIFVNLTTGTYPSPFWLIYVDSIWRGGEDHSFAGVGSWRERWITYRDAQTYRNIVLGGPLFPLNSLMLHGLIYARQAEHLNTDPGNDFENEVHSYFGSGTQLQEMYISHALLSKKDWDILAEVAKWSRRNADVLRDTHWVGGDPGKLEVYGWAAWSPRMGILTLRNPADHPQTMRINIADAFQLPPSARRRYCARRPWTDDQGRPTIVLSSQPHEFALKPFEVLTLDAAPCQ